VPGSATGVDGSIYSLTEIFELFVHLSSQMKLFPRIEPFLFYLLVVILLIPVWSVNFFVTGDGPCHLHNSKILLDFINGMKPFYDPFYYLNTMVDPNRLHTMITIPLLSIFDPTWTDRIFFTIYVLGFCFGFRYLIRSINPAAVFLSHIGVLFCFHKLVMQGFLNNALSLAVWFWVAGWWWRHRKTSSLPVLFGTAFLFILFYSSHPIGFTFGLLMIGCMLAGMILYALHIQGWRDAKAGVSTWVFGLGLSVLPAMVMFAEYYIRSTFSVDTENHLFADTLKNLLQLKSLVTMHSPEVPMAMMTSVVCLLILTGAIIMRIREKKWKEEDGLLLFFLLTLYLIFAPPAGISGGLAVSVRLVMIPFLALLCWAATATWPRWSQWITAGIALPLVIGFTAARLPAHKAADVYAQEVYNCGSYMQDTSTLLVLNYDWRGRTPEGKIFTEHAELFSHVDCYLGTSKSLIISDNYEAHFYYFPLIVRWNTNMYTQTDKDGINFDHKPPRADILNYKNRTNHDLDYVLMISYREEFKDHPYTIEIFDQLNQAYTKVHTSEFGRAILYRRNDIPDL
jgi:hypothetical protein